MSGIQDSESAFAEIIVQGYSPRYVAAARRLLAMEGGFVDDPADRGGATSFGISLRFLRAEGAFDDDADGRADFDLDMDGDIDGRDIRLLTRGDAIYLYYRCFWARLSCDSFARPLGEMLFDQAVNGGATAARKLLQLAVNACLARSGERQIEVDGRIGLETRDAIDRVLQRAGTGMAALIAAFRAAAEDRYRAIAARDPRQAKFLKGWLNRAAALGRA